MNNRLLSKTLEYFFVPAKGSSILETPALPDVREYGSFWRVR